MPKQTDVARMMGIDFLTKLQSEENLRIVIGELVKRNPTALAEALLHTAYRANGNDHSKAARMALRLKGFKYMLKVVCTRYPDFIRMSSHTQAEVLGRWHIPCTKKQIEEGHDRYLR